MQNKYLILFFLLFSTCESYPQDPEYTKYIQSFKATSADEIYDFGRTVQTSNAMSTEEAVRYVYHGDTSKLHCSQRIINMETEKDEGISRELYLPDKCMKIDQGSYLLIAYTSYQCRAVNETVKIKLILKTMTKNYLAVDSLVVYEGDDYDHEITGLLNPKAGKLVLAGHPDGVDEPQAILYSIDNNMKFKIEAKNKVRRLRDDLNLLIKDLAWQELFGLKDE